MNGRIEVAQVVTRFIAGAGGVALRGAMALDPDKFHVTIVTGQGDRLLKRAAAAGMSVQVEPSLVPQLRPTQDAKALRRLTALIRERGFDVVHTHSAKAGALGRTAAHRAGVPMVVHTHHGFPFHDFQGRARRASYLAVERHLARYTDQVLAIGTGVATEVVRLGLARPGAVRTVAPVVDSRCVIATPHSRETARKRLGIAAGVPLIGTVGRLDFQKAPDDFVAAIGMLRHSDAHAIWIGSGPLHAETRSLISAAGLSERVHLAGERDDVPDLLPALDVFAMSSRYEGLPCAVVEAMRCGIPVVATAVNSVPDLVIPGESGLLVPAGSPKELAAAMDWVLLHGHDSDRLAHNARQLVGAQFDAASLGQVLTEVYAGPPVQLQEAG